MASDATFEEMTLPAESFFNGSDSSGDFSSGGFQFNNNYDTLFGSWDGWAVSNITDNSTPGWGNQYSAIPGIGAGGSSNYGVAYIGFVEPPEARSGVSRVIDGAYLSNTTYAYLSMFNGDAFAKKFGGATGDDEDWSLLTISGFNGKRPTGTVEFYLADYRFADNGLDYIVDDWTWVDLTSLRAVTSLEFALSSSDVGPWGMNTPAYFAMDNLVQLGGPAGPDLGNAPGKGGDSANALVTDIVLPNLALGNTGRALRDAVTGRLGLGLADDPEAFLSAPLALDGSVAVVPEPASMALLAVGAVALLRRRR